MLNFNYQGNDYDYTTILKFIGSFTRRAGLPPGVSEPTSVHM